MKALKLSVSQNFGGVAVATTHCIIFVMIIGGRFDANIVGID